MIHIAESEWTIMKVLWKESPLTSREIINHLASSTDWNAKTVHTLIGRLCKKEAIRAEKQGSSPFYLYYANVTEQECTISEAKHFLKRLFNGSVKNFVSAFVEDNEISESDMKELRALLDKYESGEKK